MVGIATATTYSGILAALNSAQAAENSAIAQISSGMKATDLKGYGANAETLTAMQTVQAKVTSYLGQTQVLSDKLSTQETALKAVASAAQGASAAVTNALGSGDGSTVMQALEGYFQDASGALNTQFNGEYLFSGGQVNTPAVSSTTLTNLTTVAVQSVFHNDQTTPSAQLDGSTTVQTGYLADQVGSPLFTALQAIASYDQGPNGPFGAKEAGEGSLAAILPALTNAIADAIGLRFNDLPVTPDRVFAALEKRQRAAAKGSAKGNSKSE